MRADLQSKLSSFHEYRSKTHLEADNTQVRLLLFSAPQDGRETVRYHALAQAPCLDRIRFNKGGALLILRIPVSDMSQWPVD
nr:hypothetical protein CFP56_74316 [Quercus suber]